MYTTGVAGSPRGRRQLMKTDEAARKVATDIMRSMSECGIPSVDFLNLLPEVFELVVCGWCDAYGIPKESAATVIMERAFAVSEAIISEKETKEQN